MLLKILRITLKFIGAVILGALAIAFIPAVILAAEFMLHDPSRRDALFSGFNQFASEVMPPLSIVAGVLAALALIRYMERKLKTALLLPESQDTRKKKKEEYTDYYDALALADEAEPLPEVYYEEAAARTARSR
jgi:hypothetical protein